jgi:hypothetical protein
MVSAYPAPFASDGAVRSLCRAFLTHDLPKEAWTHEAHLALTVWAIGERSDLVPERDFPQLIRDFNVSKGGVNDDRHGYHETITQTFIVGARSFVAGRPVEEGLADRINALARSNEGAREWPLRFYSPHRLFSVTARRSFVEPDLAPLPTIDGSLARRLAE